VTACHFNFRTFPAFLQSTLCNKSSYHPRKKQQASLIVLQPPLFNMDTWTVFEELNIWGLNWPSMMAALG